MDKYVSVIFCRSCGSRHVEVPDWSEEGKVIIHCRGCNVKEEVTNFTLGRGCMSDKEVQSARDTAALKDRFER